MPATVDVERFAVGFARVLRGAGLDVPVGTVVTYAEALAAVGIEGRSGVYWAGRTTLVRRVEDVPLYNRAFRAWWLAWHDDGTRIRDASRRNHPSPRRRGRARCGAGARR